MTTPSLEAWLAEPRPELAAAVADGIRLHLEKLRARGFAIYGYAVCPGETNQISNLVAVMNTEADFEKARAAANPKYGCPRYLVGDWAHWEHDEFTAANALIANANEQFNRLHTKDEDDFAYDDYEIAHAKILRDSIEQGMQLAKSNAFFGPKELFLITWYPDAGEELLVASARRLNSPATANDFIKDLGYDPENYPLG